MGGAIHKTCKNIVMILAARLAHSLSAADHLHAQILSPPSLHGLIYFSQPYYLSAEERTQCTTPFISAGAFGETAAGL